MWITPAASGAVAPIGISQARVSFGPAVRNVCSPSARNPADARYCDSPGSPMPASASSSAASSSGSSANRTLAPRPFRIEIVAGQTRFAGVSIPGVKIGWVESDESAALHEWNATFSHEPLNMAL